MMLQMYIVITTYNAMKWLMNCLDSTSPYKVIVVDNNSTDGTPNYIRHHYPEVILMEQEKNLGFGQANNLGISYALARGAEAIFLLNQDASLVPGIIEKLYLVLKEKKDFGILSPIHLDGSGNRLDRNFFSYVKPDANLDFFSDFVIGKDLKDVYEVPFVNAAAWLISKECLERVGGFDPLFFHYGEDENYCQRVRYFNLKIGVVPSTYIFHDRNQEPEMPDKYGSDYYFQRLEKEYKIYFGDINSNKRQLEIGKLKEKRRKNFIKAIMKFNISYAKYYKRDYKILNRLESVIKKSRESNKAGGKIYLQK